MLIISWNVAGLSPLLQRVHDDYCTESVNYANKDASNKDEIRIKPKLPRNHAFSHYLRKHGSPDVLCLQEHKIPKHKLSSRSEPFGCAYLDGYESFWSCCVDPKRKVCFVVYPLLVGVRDLGTMVRSSILGGFSKKVITNELLLIRVRRCYI